MNNFIFENETKVFFGRGCVKEYLACLTKGYGDTVILAFGGGSIKKNGIYEEIRSVLRTAGKEVTEFSGIMPNPTYGKVLEGARLARENKVDLILGAGGGSVMDCCKRFLWQRSMRGTYGLISGRNPVLWKQLPCPWA